MGALLSNNRREAGQSPNGVEVTAGNLMGLDLLEQELVGMFCWRDERPLSGVSGFIDWRTCGMVSRALVSGDLEGESGESLLFAVSGRFGPRALLVFGLGSSLDCSQERFVKSASNALEALKKAGAKRMILAAPSLRGKPEIEEQFVAAVRAALGNQSCRILVENPRI